MHFKNHVATVNKIDLRPRAFPLLISHLATSLLRHVLPGVIWTPIQLKLGAVCDLRPRSLTHFLVFANIWALGRLPGSVHVPYVYKEAGPSAQIYAC